MRPLLWRGFLVAALLPVLLTARVEACIWFHGTNVHGIPMQVSGRKPEQYMEMLERRISRSTWEEKRQRFQEVVRKFGDWESRSDLAAVLLHLGEIDRAIELLEGVEREQPGEYITAANLGTAYELAGRNRDALEWIREGIRRNPEAHQGTEWLHENVLEAKLALEDDPSWLESHTVLGLDFGNGRKPRRPASERLEEAESALLYQLGERLQFVDRPDAIVADLLFDLGNALSLTKSLEHAIPVYDLALDYGPAREELVCARRDRAVTLSARSRWFSWVPKLFEFPFSVFTLLASIAVVAWLVGRLRARTSPPTPPETPPSPVR